MKINTKYKLDTNNVFLPVSWALLPNDSSRPIIIIVVVVVVVVIFPECHTRSYTKTASRRWS